MDSKYIHAMIYMAVQFNLHMAKRFIQIFFPPEDQVEKFRRNFIDDHIVELSPEERERLAAWEACVNCGHCSAWCPVTNALSSRVFAGPRELCLSFSRAVPDFFATKDQIYLCTLCRRCEVFCPYNVPVAEIARFVRRKIARVDGKYVPAALRQAEERVISSGLYTSERPAWWRDYEKDKAEYVLFAGCRSFRNEKALRAAVELFSRLKIDFTTIPEVCCGGFLADVGLGEGYEGDKKNWEQIKKKAAKKIVSLCPLCLRSLVKQAAPEEVEVIHYTELLAQKDFPLAPDSRPVVYHDAALLARDLRITNFPRALIRRAASDLRELPENREAAAASGAEGGLPETDPQAAARLAQTVIASAQAVGAKLLISADLADALLFEEHAGADILAMDLLTYLHNQAK